MGKHSKSAIIKYNRRYLRITQEELAENICDVATLAKYESGKMEPSDENFAKLMLKMGISGETYSVPLPYFSEKQEYELREIMVNLQTGNDEAVELGLQRLKAEMKETAEYPENRQCLRRLELILDFKSNKISAEEYISGMTKALHITFQKYNEAHFPVYRIFTENEILIINNIATRYGAKGDIDTAFRLFANLEEYFDKNIVIMDYKPRYLILISYSCRLGLEGRYDESIEISKRGIQWLKKHHKSNVLYNFYYNIGWCLKKKIDEKKADESLLPSAKAYVWLGCQLCKLYNENPRNYTIMKSFYEKM